MRSGAFGREGGGGGGRPQRKEPALCKKFPFFYLLLYLHHIICSWARGGLLFGRAPFSLRGAARALFGPRPGPACGHGPKIALGVPRAAAFRAPTHWALAPQRRRFAPQRIGGSPNALGPRPLCVRRIAFTREQHSMLFPSERNAPNAQGQAAMRSGAGGVMWSGTTQQDHKGNALGRKGGRKVSAFPLWSCAFGQVRERIPLVALCVPPFPQGVPRPFRPRDRHPEHPPKSRKSSRACGARGRGGAGGREGRRAGRKAFRLQEIIPFFYFYSISGINYVLHRIRLPFLSPGPGRYRVLLAPFSALRLAQPAASLRKRR